MMRLNEIREKHPEYNDLSDQQLADGIYQKHYSDVPRSAFDEVIGLDPLSRTPSEIVSGRDKLQLMPTREQEQAAVQRAGGYGPLLKRGLAETGKRLGAISAGAVQEARRFAGEETPGYMAQAAAPYPLESRIGRGGLDIAASIPLLEGLGSLGGKIVEGVAELGPRALRYAKPVGQAIGRVVGQSALGAMGAPEGERGTGAALGATLGTAAEAIPGGWKLGKSLTQKFLQKYSPEFAVRSIMGNIPKTVSAENVLSNLGRGKSLDENAVDTAKQIKDNGKLRIRASNERFEEINKQLGDESIYNRGKIPDDYLSFTTPQKTLERTTETFQGKPVTVLKEAKTKLPEDSPAPDYTTNIKKAHKHFVKNKNWATAHKLQSTIADEAFPVVNSRTANMQERSIAQSFLDGRQKLLGDMYNYLKKYDPTEGMLNEYKNAVRLHKNEVIPYRHRDIHPIVKGDVDNPGNLTKIFSNPQPEIRKVAGDLGQRGRDQIVYNDLRSRAGKNPTAEKLINVFGDLPKRGLNNYISDDFRNSMQQMYPRKAVESFTKRVGAKPTIKRMITAAGKLEDTGEASDLPGNLRDQLEQLTTKVGGKETRQKVAGAIAGGAIGRMLGLPFLAEMASVGAGTVALPKLLEQAGLPGAAVAAKSRFLRPMYHALTRRLLPYYLAQRGR